jgi:hypothetical protein
MGRPYPNRRRRRPGRRPPNRYRDAGKPRAQGFTAGPFGALYGATMPGLRGGEKRAFFNGVAGHLIIGFGVGGAITGGSIGGPLGALAGLGAGVAFGGVVAGRGRFHRP